MNQAYDAQKIAIPLVIILTACSQSELWKVWSIPDITRFRFPGRYSGYINPPTRDVIRYIVLNLEQDRSKLFPSFLWSFTYCKLHGGYHFCSVIVRR